MRVRTERWARRRDRGGRGAWASRAGTGPP